jgi:DNA-directed RNA polymerase specialized sigma24 family protein
MSEDAVTQWLHGLADGDESAIREIWQLYYSRLVNLAEQRLRGRSRRTADGEDVALSAFHSFCQASAAGAFPRLESRDDLWRILVTITARKASIHMRDSCRKKRGGGTVRGESVFLRADASEAYGGLNEVMGREPTPELAVQMAEQCQRLLDRLPDETLRDIAVRKLQGYLNEEIARQLDCTPRTIERKLARIRALWQEEATV